MEIKKCSRCNEDRIFPDEFHYRKDRNYYYPYCKVCHRKYTKNHYQNNKKYYSDKARRNSDRYKIKIYSWLYRYFLTHPCIDCGETDPIVLDFDHRNGDDKLSEVSTLVKKGNLSEVKREVAKCDVRCSNCHRRKTAMQREYFWIEFLRINRFLDTIKK